MTMDRAQVAADLARMLPQFPSDTLVAMLSVIHEELTRRDVEALYARAQQAAVERRLKGEGG